MAETWTEAQYQELAEIARRALVPHVRLKARAVLQLAQGARQGAMAQAYGVHRTTLAAWVRRYRTVGAAGFAVSPGRGRPTPVAVAEIAAYLRQPPRQFGVPRTRWTLRSLAEAVPCLRGMSAQGVLHALRRSGFRYKRGQPQVHSPDPAYGEKKGAWSRQ